MFNEVMFNEVAFIVLGCNCLTLMVHVSVIRYFPHSVAELSEIPVAQVSNKMKEEESSTVVSHKEAENCSKIGNSVYIVLGTLRTLHGVFCTY